MKTYYITCLPLLAFNLYCCYATYTSTSSSYFTKSTPTPTIATPTSIEYATKSTPTPPIATPSYTSTSSGCATKSTPSPTMPLASTTTATTYTDCDACPITACMDYPVIPLSASQLSASSPFIMQQLLNCPVLKQDDSQCLTYKHLYNNTYLYFLTSAKKDGTSTTGVSFMADGPQGPGTYIITGIVENSAKIAYGYLLDSSCSGNNSIFSALTLTLAEDCSHEFGYNPVLSFSPHPQITKDCLGQSLYILEDYTTPGSVIGLPKKMPVQCVADYLGSPVINYDVLFNNPDIVPLTYPSMAPSTVG